MNKLIALFLCLLIPSLAIAEGQTPGGLPPAALSRTGRQFIHHIPSVRNNIAPLTAGTCVVNSSTVSINLGYSVGDLGRDGKVMDISFASVAHTVTTSIGVPTYASKLMFDMYDSAPTGTLACTAAFVEGYRWDGKFVVEPLGSISETPEYTTNSFSTVTRFRASGCTGWGGLDRFRLRTSQWVALPYRITSYRDLDSICATPLNQFFAVATNTTNATKCLPITAYNFTLDLSPGANAINTLPLASDAINDSYFPVGRFHPTSQGCAQDRASFTIRGRANPQETSF